MRGVLFSIIILITIVFAWWFSTYPNELPSLIGEEETFTSDQNLINKNTEVALTEEAENYIDKITEAPINSIDMDNADDFVTKDQSISLGDSKEIETLSLNQLEQSNLNRNSPITLIQSQQQIIHKTPSDILLEAKGDGSQRIQYLENDAVVDTTIDELLKKYPLDTIENIAVITNIENYLVTTADELLQNSDINKDEPLKIIKKPYRETTTSIGELLLGDESISNDDIFYVRNISEADQAGIWGIVQDGLLQNFAKGIAIKRGENYAKYQIEIPQEADEKLADQTSSFLGKLIHDKSQKSYVYNFEKGKMGRNPDLIYPGSEIVIIQFTQDELIKIYKHFIDKSKT